MKELKKSVRYARGSVWYVNFNGVRDTPEGGILMKNRPCLIISNNYNNLYSETVNVIPITSGIHFIKTQTFGVYDFKSEMDVKRVICSQITVINKSRLRNYMYTLDDDTMTEISDLLIKTLAGLPINQYNPAECIETQQYETRQLDVVSSVKTDPQASLREHVDNIVSFKSNSGQKWNEASKIKFLNFVNEHGVNRAQLEYKISLASVKSYKSRFVKELVDKIYISDSNSLSTELVVK